MPIRFACPHCQHRLSFSTRMAETSAACPHCGQTLTIPPQPAAEAGSQDIELIYQLAGEPPPPAPPPKPVQMIALPRYLLYVQGGLIAVVALLSFALGVLFGSTLFTRSAPPAAPQACAISGSVTFASGSRELPDAGAVIFVLPFITKRLDERAPIAGLRPGDPPPEASHRGLAIIEQLGGGYARADANGRFRIQVAGRRRYLVLVISHGHKARSVEDVKTGEILKIGRFFSDATDLIGDRSYLLTEESLSGDRQYSVTFD